MHLQGVHSSIGAIIVPSLPSSFRQLIKIPRNQIGNEGNAITSCNNNHLSSHEKSIIKRKKERKYKKYGGLEQKPYVNKNDT